MLMLDIPSDKQAVIEQASQMANLSLNDFAVNQLYYASLAMINQKKIARPLSIDNVGEKYGIFGLFAHQGKIIGDIVEPIGQDDWDYSEREARILEGKA